MKARGRFSYGDKPNEDLVRETFSGQPDMLHQRVALFHWAYFVSEAIEQVARAQRETRRIYDRAMRVASDAENWPAVSELETRWARFRHIGIAVPCSRQVVLRLDRPWPNEGKGRTIEYQLSGMFGVRGRCVGFDDPAPELYAIVRPDSFDDARAEAGRAVAHAVGILRVRQEQFAVPLIDE